MQIESCPRSKLFDLGVGWNLQAISEQFIWHLKSEWNDEIEHSEGAGLSAVQSTERSDPAEGVNEAVLVVFHFCGAGNQVPRLRSPASL